jgi:hypothetical protein
MPDTCSCGAQLVSDALFCHKCGKPLRDIPEPESTGAVPVMKIDPVYPPVNFHNGTAVRVALIMAVLATLLFFLPFVNWLAAGFFAVLLYARRTGYLMNLESGLRMGWITGVLIFVIVMVLITISFVLISAAGGLAALPPEAREAFGPRFQEAMKVFESAPRVAEMLVMYFMLITLLSMAGGALGAKLSTRGSDQSL